MLLLLGSLYKKKSSVSIRFLAGICCGWMISILCLILYLSKQSYYWQEVNTIFYVPKSLWNVLISTVNIRADMLIRGINIGVGLLYYSVICFGVAFISKRGKQNRKKYLLFSISPILQILLFDPKVQSYLQHEIVYTLGASYREYNTMYKYLEHICRTINLLYCIFGLALLLYYYIYYPKIKFLGIYTLFNLICITPITILFYYVFRWYPTILIKPTFKPGYYNYLIPHFQGNIRSNQIYFFVFFVLYLALTVYIYKYSTMEDYYKKDYAKIDISMDLTNIGINGFTHTIKNHIQGIKSETEYLAERYSTDEEVNMSTKLILESCDICFISIEYANKHLKNLNLTLKLIPIVNPIKLALDQMKSVDDKIEITYNERVGNTMAYIDEGAFRQVMINLILNAVEAIEEKNNGKIDLMIQEKGRWGMIQVIDNGKGIDEVNLNKIFTPFFSTKSPINNWGIGLAFCYKVIKAHDGKITVESKVGEGTKFTILLPIV